MTACFTSFYVQNKTTWTFRGKAAPPQAGFRGAPGGETFPDRGERLKGGRPLGPGLPSEKAIVIGRKLWKHEGFIGFHDV